MKYNEVQMDIIFNKYIGFIDNLDYYYNDNIKNLLYIILPAFVLKYGIDNEKIVLKTFSDVRIIISDESNSKTPAFYKSIISRNNDNLVVNNVIVLRNYHDNNTVQLLDNLVHEFNHAINSIINNISYLDNVILIRTGLSYIRYDKDTLEFISKDDNYILEEILNTKETEEIINIIHSFKDYEFSNKKIVTALYYVDNHIRIKYSSDSYKLEMFITNKLTDNKLFMATLSNLRVKGNINDIEYWFDDIVGIKNSFNELVSIIIKVEKLKSVKPIFIMGKRKLKRDINNYYKSALVIIDMFNNNCNYK